MERDRAVVFDIAGLAFTLAAGTAALAIGRRAARSPRASRWAAAAALSVPALVAVLAACWGVYAAEGAPELGLGAPPVAAFVGLSALSPGPLPPAVALGAALGALAALFAAGLNTVGELLLRLTGRGEAVSHLRLAWTAMIVVAAGLAVPGFDAWRALTWGWGLAASAVLAPALVGGSARGRRAAAVFGALVFGVLAFGGRALVPGVPLLADYPVLVAMPTAWLVAAALGRRRRASRAPLTSSRVAPARRG